MLNPPYSHRFLARCICTGVALAGFFFSETALAESAASSRDDLAWLKTKGTLLFEDSFEREETGTGLKDIGNGWENATADRVKGIKQADLDQGILKVNSATKEAGHMSHIHHDAGFTDGGVYLRYRLPGSVKGYRLQVGFVDREVSSTIHAGHLCYAFLSEDSIMLKDSGTGFHSLEVQKRIEAGKKATGKMPEDIAALLKTKESTVPWKTDQGWHDLVLVTEGDEMRLSIDGKLVHQFKSAGFAHPAKRWVSLLTANAYWVDEVKVWKVK
jgi:hypothetical protein